MTATGRPKYHRGFEPLPEGFAYFDYNDINSLEAALRSTVIAPWRCCWNPCRRGRHPAGDRAFFPACASSAMSANCC